MALSSSSIPRNLLALSSRQGSKLNSASVPCYSRRWLASGPFMASSPRCRLDPSFCTGRFALTSLHPGGALPARWGGSVQYSASATAGAGRDEAGAGGGKGDGKQQAKGEEEKKDKKKEKDDSNIFLDNLGKIFLGVIGGVVLMLFRSSRGTANKTAARDRIESLSVLDPLEIDDLRVANSELTRDVWDEIAREVRASFPSGRATYEDFVSVTIQVMKRLKGEAFTVQLGHLLDRVAIATIGSYVDSAKDSKEATFNADGNDDNETRKDLPLPLLFVILSLAFNSGVSDRVKVLFEVMRHDREEVADGTVSEEDVVRMVDYLQRTSQLVPDAQIVYSDVKYPVQEYRKGSPKDLVAGAKKTMLEDGTKNADSDNVSRYDESEFHRLLRTKSICAWGECYVKKRGLD